MTGKARDLRGVGKPVGSVMAGLGAILGLCAGVGAVMEEFAPRESGPSGGATALAIAAIVTVALGSLVFAYGRRHSRGRGETLTRREAVLAVALIWLAAGACGALPFVLGTSMTPVDAFFESISGLTTTGATVVTDIEGSLPRPLLLWRALLQWLGGMGIVVLFVAVFPSIGAGGKHMFRGEVPGATSEGLKPRIAETSITLWKIYAGLTVAEVAVLIALGVRPFEAVCHAFTTISTGGFSTRDASIGAFDSTAIEIAISVFMLLAAVNFGLYYAALRGRRLRVFVQSVELRTYAGIVLVAVAALTIGLLTVHGDLGVSFRYALFQVATFVTSTGYTTDTYMAYPAPALAVVLFLMFAGGSSGSTAGGIKIERLILLAKQSWTEIHQSFRPNVVRVVRMGRKVIDNEVLADVAAFFVVYMGCMAVGIVAVAALEPVPLPTAFGAVLSCLSNMGPAPFYLGDDNFAAYSGPTKVVFALGMVLGRLEFFTLFALLVPGFWRR